MRVMDRDWMIEGGRSGHLDLAGAVVSGVCALHCALMPALATILPLVGLGMLADEGTEAGLLATSAALATVGIGLGYRRHRSGRVVAGVAVGLCLLGVGHLAEGQGFELPGTVAIVAGGLAVAGSHLLNRRLCRSCPECREARPGCGDRLGSLSPTTPATSGRAGGAIPPAGGGPSDPGADRRSASLTSIR